MTLFTIPSKCLVFVCTLLFFRPEDSQRNIYEPVCLVCAGTKWFPGARLNFAENLLKFRDDSVAYEFLNDAMKEPQRITYRYMLGPLDLFAQVCVTFILNLYMLFNIISQVYERVARLAKAMRDAGVVKGLIAHISKVLIEDHDSLPAP
jgi:hypothetical protein